MIAYFAAAPVELYLTMLHKLTYEQNSNAILFVDKNAYHVRRMEKVLLNLSSYGIFSEALGCDTVCQTKVKLSNNAKENEKLVIKHFDEMFQNCGHKPEDFEKNIF